ncbi:unnamed protein product [Triticum aestivum]|uniref:Integrase catalytic domain-containing protein n=1 Tax=Triticum aestivum TaxID=4565 RepID=A0A7H4LPP6_WHEAT|nr:unnamed protein product [Triticum aestivum]
MLQGTARTWLYSLKPRSINSWVNFTEAFIGNFTSTYKRPPKPCQLSLCVQGLDESTRDYLMRWGELRNSCEGMQEVQAFKYFTAGCREGTLLKHKLLYDKPETLDELLVIADKYATADSSMKTEIQVNTTGKVAPQAPRTPARDTSRRQPQNDSKRKAQQPTSSSRQFMAVPHYAYLKMKMPSSKGILTITGDYKKSSACAAESSRLAESLVIAAEKRLLDRVMAMVVKQPEMSPDPKESEAEGSFKPAKETKKIPLDPEHPERLKTAFITPFRAFCYLTMTFGLRNADATFQRCMQKCLLKQLDRNAHIYVDDVVVKTEKRGTLLEDLKETFENLRRFQIKLNPEKCVFRVPAGQLLGFLFTKWIEAKPIKKLNGPTAVTFIADITMRYGIPHSIITDNGTNFAKGTLAHFYATQGIRLDLASVAHPQSNGQVERANGLILSSIKPRLVEPLERSADCWLEELPAVLWSLRTTPNKSNGFTPFFLVYGAEAVIPADKEFDSPRVTMYTEEEAEEA